MGSTAGSLIGVAQRGLSPSGGDFNLVLVQLVPPGGHVKKGDVIAEFDRQSQLNRLDDYKDSVIQLDANIKKMKADLAVAKEAHDQLIRSAKADRDKAELDLKTAPVRSAIEAESLQLSVDETQAHYKQIAGEAKLVEDSQRAQIRVAEIDRDRSKIEFERAKKNVDRMVMRAPIDGVAVMQSIFRGGDFGQVQQGDQLYPGMQFMQVVDPRSMVITAVINQVDAEAVRIGMKATARIDAYPGLELPAHIVGIGAMSKPGVWRPDYMREIPVRLKLDRMDPRVIPDVSASADIRTGGEKIVRVVPVNAVFYDSPSGKPYVFTRGPTGWEKRGVELGISNHIVTALHSGVEKGEVVALERPDRERLASEKQ
ncbi:MAG: HlyD family efflux transporter periplasmic adaptor subunit [Acidobacteriota bacterium]|nr:HlyD family efflux transporter periplasmic adaptor subunit [Acidobacteriota bacterium]